MNFTRRLLAAALAGAAFAAPVLAAEHGTAAEATALARKAVAYYKAQGRDKALAEISNKSGPFVDRDLYVYVLDTQGVVVAHGVNDKLVGKALMQLKDADGKLFVQDLVGVVKSGKPGWVDYKWPNPVSKQIEQKSTYVEPVGELGFAVGVYK